MSTKVFSWPPVGVVGHEWTESAPVEGSRSLITGREYLSAAQRIRRLATFVVAGIGRNRSHAGYMEMLKRHLAGVHAVRLYSLPINWHVRADDGLAALQSQPVAWTEAGDPLAWTAGGEPLYWFSGAYLTGTTENDGVWSSITVTGLPPKSVAARPGEFLTIFSDHEDDEGFTAQATRLETSDGSGVARIRVFETLPALTDARVNLRTRATGVFKPVAYPRAVQPLSGDWSYTWQFREIFEDEVDGGFVERNPWG